MLFRSVFKERPPKPPKTELEGCSKKDAWFCPSSRGGSFVFILAACLTAIVVRIHVCGKVQFLERVENSALMLLCQVGYAQDSLCIVNRHRWRVGGEMRYSSPVLANQSCNYKTSALFDK